MSFNPFEEKGERLNAFENWKQLYPREYDKNATDPKTKMRIILMNGTEFEAQWFLHNMARHTADKAHPKVPDTALYFCIPEIRDKHKTFHIALS